MFKNKIIKNKRAGSAGDTMSLVVTFVILLIIFVFAFAWTQKILLLKVINLERSIFNEDPSIDSFSQVIFYKKLIAKYISQQINLETLNNER